MTVTATEKDMRNVLSLVAKDMAKLTRERDELVAALREAQVLLAGPRSEARQWEAEVVIRAALAKVLQS